MLKSVNADLFYDKVLDGKVYPGLASVITVYTSMGFDPGSEAANARLQERQAAEGEGAAPRAGGARHRRHGDRARSSRSRSRVSAPGSTSTPLPAPCCAGLFDRSEIPDLVIDAILRYRNEVDEEAQEAAETSSTDDYGGDVDLGVSEPKKFFATVEDLDEIPEWQNLGDPNIKQAFYELCGVRSDVFSIHMAGVYKLSETNRTFVMRRACSVMMRLENAESGYLHPFVLLEERRGLRVQGQDFPDEASDDLLYGIYSEMDSFSQEERAWNPFLAEFYLPQEDRQNFYDPEWR